MVKIMKNMEIIIIIIIMLMSACFFFLLRKIRRRTHDSVFHQLNLGYFSEPIDVNPFFKDNSHSTTIYMREKKESPLIHQPYKYNQVYDAQFDNIFTHTNTHAHHNYALIQL